MHQFDELNYHHFPGGRPPWPWADWRERADVPTKTTKSVRNRLERGQAVTPQGYAISLAPRPAWRGSKLAEDKATRRVMAHGDAR